jgi:hypothetical protein
VVLALAKWRWIEKDWPDGFRIFVTGTSTNRGGRASKAVETAHAAFGFDSVRVTTQGASCAPAWIITPQAVNANNMDIPRQPAGITT